MENKNVLVLDCGSGHTKIGWSYQTFPELTYSTVIGRPILRTKSTPDGMEIKVNFNIRKIAHFCPFGAVLTIF
jgi:actin-related protein